MKTQLRIVLAQTNFLVGAIEKNAEIIIKKSLIARDEFNADIIAFPELMLTGYNADDLLLRPETYTRITTAIEKISNSIQGIDVIFGLPMFINENHYNGAIVLRDGKIIADYQKQELPNYGVFDEKRYFKAGSAKPCIFTSRNGIPIALIICEDLWVTEPTAQIKQTNAQLIIDLNASPFDIKKQARRAHILRERAQFLQLPILYVNYMGGQDSMVFDGNSMVVNSEGHIVQQAPEFEEILMPVNFELKDTHINLSYRVANNQPKPFNKAATIYKALVLGIRDYVQKNHIKGIILGLSGGIDSALALTLAVDAIGKEQVEAVMMPAQYTSQLSLAMAAEQAKTMGVKYSVINIESIYHAFIISLEAEFGNTNKDITEENLQARIRGNLLMAIANKKQLLLLSTSNKSELAVGYSTIYGDMSGGFCALKDVYKTVVYELANYRNSISPIIPEAVIKRAPSAELAPNQKDQDSLPPYEILDAILERYIEQNESAEKIIAAGFDKKTVEKAIRLIKRAEFKRHQSPPGVRITPRAFGKDWRLPITNHY